MLDIDVMNTSESVVTDFPPVTAEPLNERADEIASLWAAHVNATTLSKATKEEIRTIRTKLAEQLHEMKRLLASPGRDGQWSGFLREHKIPRASADRLVARHEQLINPTANCVSEPISEPTTEDVQKLFASVWPKLMRTLRSRESLDLFIHLLTDHFECGEADQVLVLPAAAPTICPASLDGESFGERELGAALVASTGEQQG
jgi:hypothetical protein